MKRILLILLGAVVAIILWNVGAAVVGALPLFLLCLMVSVGKGHARKVSELLQQFVDSGDRSSPIFELPEQESQSILNVVCTLTGTSLQKARRDYAISLTALTGLYWYLGGSAKVLCSLTPKDANRSSLQTRLTVQYKQQAAVRTLRIISIE